MYHTPYTNQTIKVKQDINPISLRLFIQQNCGHTVKEGSANEIKCRYLYFLS